MTADQEWNLKRVFLTAFFSALFISLNFAGYVLTISKDSCSGVLLWIKDSNLHLYFVMLCLFFLVFFGVRISFLFLQFTLGGDGTYIIPIWQQRFLVAVPVIAVLGMLAHWLCVNHGGEFPFTGYQSLLILSIPRPAAVVILAAGAVLALLMTVWKKDMPDLCLYVIYAVCLVLYFDALNYVNIFNGDVWHSIATTETIYNVCDLTPYSKVTTGIYGHYGLFFLLPMRIAHGSPYMLAAMMGLSGCVAEAAVLYICHILLPKNILRAGAAFSSIFFVTVYMASQYWQSFPIRIMFPMLMCAYACFLAKRSKTVWRTRRMWLGYLLAGLAVLWNTETGIFCLAAFDAYLLIEQLQKQQWYQKCMWGIYAGLMLLSAGSIFFALGIVNFYNLCCGGKLIFRAFFFPLFSDSYMEDVLRYDPPWGNYAWIYTFFLFMALLAWAVYHTRLFQSSVREHVYKASAAAVIALCGLLPFSYYLNRAAYGNLSICFHAAVCANVLVLSETWTVIRQAAGRKTSLECLARRAVSIVIIVIISILAAQIPLAAVRMSDRRKAGVYELDDIKKDLAVLAERLPENTYGEGIGISIFYHMLGWDNYAHVRDISDFYVDGIEAAEFAAAELLEHKEFLMDSRDPRLLARIYLQKPYYEIVDTFTIHGYTFHYYKECEQEITDWLHRVVSVSEENEKSTDDTICISQGQYVAGPDIFMEKGEYALSVTADQAAEAEVSCGQDTVILKQNLKEGGNRIVFSLNEDTMNVRFKITNVGPAQLKLTKMNMQAINQ